MLSTRGKINLNAARITIQQFKDLLQDNRSLREIHGLDFIYGEFVPTFGNALDVVTIRPYNAAIRILTISTDDENAYVCYDVLDSHYKDMVLEMDLYNLALVPRCVYDGKTGIPTRLITIDVMKLKGEQQ